ncbi:hypothetical protein HU200_008442 [Digitaria exilis]|uniref:Uncharacterized protein n=1 Tax=Digitaria exilis TaxID=1010633 RepID=A0A835KRN8_9POAL|nr:hypothetical protein HU200_008442 [Digitaria exilis]
MHVFSCQAKRTVFLDCQGTELHGPAFEAAESLRVLDLSECSIQKLPHSIGRLRQLRYLNAPRIRDKMIPECITKLSTLRYLSLRGSCAILSLPESIGRMEGLVHLDLSGCLGIKELPGSFGNLTSLEHLDISYCKNVTELSKYLSRLTKLQYLNVSNCGNIGHLPRTLGSLTGLQYLNLSNSINMKKLPASLGKICNLVHLDLSWCSSLKDVPISSLNGLTKLQYLDLSWCYSFCAWEDLPELFGNLTELRHLNLSAFIQGIPSYHQDEINYLLRQICTLTNLEYLNLGYNDNIRCIPETLANLKKLHTLDISLTRIWRLPACISEIDSLKFLHTKEHGIDKRRLPPYSMVNSRIQPNFVSDTGGAESSRYPFRLEYIDPARLKISRLETVKSAKEARTIRLRENSDVTLLKLEWTRDAKIFVDDAEVLRELEPPYSVSQFYLEGHNSISFPPWVMRINDYLPGLTKMDSVKNIGEDLYGGTQTFPRLLELVIDEMKCLEEWNTAVSGDNDGHNMLHQIGSVKIRHCPKLRFKPRPLQCSRLEIECSDEVMLSSPGNRDFLRGHTSLKSLTVRHCQSIASLPERLGDLTSLELIDCKRMKTLPDTIQKLKCLDSLLISECPELVQWCKSKEMKLVHIKEIVCVLTPVVLCSLNASTTLLQLSMGSILSYVFYARYLISLHEIASTNVERLVPARGFSQY